MGERNLIGKASRVIGVVLVVVAVLLSIGLGPMAIEAKAGHMVKIGLLEEPKTLNIWLASDRWSLKVLGQIYHPLYIRDPETLEFVPWLAEEMPVYDEATLSYTVKLRTAKWSDGTELTSEDVAFTGGFINEFKVPRYRYKWNFIKKIETPDKRTVKFYLKEPKAIFLTRTLTTPIVPKKEWVKVAEEARKAEKPLTFLRNYKIEKPVGSGPFALKEWRQGAYLFLQKNKHFFGTGKTINNRLLGPYVDGVIFKVFGTSDAAVLALKKGKLDMFWWNIQSGYLEDLQKEENIRIFSNERSALYYMGFNVRKAPFNDANLRRAIATLIDKDFIISRVLQGNGIKMRSFVPPGNRFYHCPDVRTYGEGLSKEDRIKRAFDILTNAGYSWKVPPVDGMGNVSEGQEIRLPGGQPMEKFTILTPPADYDPTRAMTGMLIQEWLRELGIPASSKPMAFGSLIQQVKTRREFDTFVLAYGALSLDPDWVRSFFHSRNDKKRGRNMSGYKNPEFDRIADESSGAMDKEHRRKLVWEMQKILLNDVPYIPLYNPKMIEAVRKAQYTGWVEMLEGIGNAWSFCQIKPKK
jgi:ABC-type transport system substrate-binding protein